ncbi:hypothetical protein N9A22_02595 [Methylophilaceae bacterium]|nr:hypothetical protein [Methylophilaceae bacterium]
MMKWIKIIATFTMLGAFSNLNAQGHCNQEGIAEEDADGVITFTGSVDNMGGCNFAPDEYTVTIYKLALCTDLPTRPTVNTEYDVSSCVDVIDSPNGQQVNLAAGSEIILDDTLRPANGTYAYGYILMANVFGIKASKQFTNTMHTYRNGPAGNFCWTLDSSAFNSDSDTRPDPPPNPTTYLRCGSVAETAGTFNEALDMFGPNVYDTGPFPVESGTLSADLITDASKRLVNADKTADRLLGVQTFTSSVNVNSSSSLFTVSFGVNQASSMWMENQGNPNEYNVRAIGSGPFSSFMTVE